jgi:hypothetical protein
MRSSTSSSDGSGSEPGAPPPNVHETRPGFVRLTASDRPGVAQPVPERDIPAQPWGRIWISALLLAIALLAWWELHWRAYGVQPGYRNSDGQWAIERRRIDAGEGAKTVIVGDSRVFFDVQLPVWERIEGERPIQLAMEGTSPVPMLEDLAADPAFTGRLLIGIAPNVFFTGYAYRGNVVEYARNQGPSQRSGTWLSMHLLEPYLAFYDPDFALAVVVRRQDWWPPRPGMQSRSRVRKLANRDIDRNTHLWDKVSIDTEYRALARRIWAEGFTGPPRGMTMEQVRKSFDVQIERAATAIATMRARGVRVVFVRPPSDGEFYAYEQKYLPRADTWDRLLARTGAPGIHFEDHPQLQGYELPEWSHMTKAEAERFTAELVPLVLAEFRRQEAVGTTDTATPSASP